MVVECYEFQSNSFLWYFYFSLKSYIDHIYDRPTSQKLEGRRILTLSVFYLIISLMFDNTFGTNKYKFIGSCVYKLFLLLVKTYIFYTNVNFFFVYLTDLSQLKEERKYTYMATYIYCIFFLFFFYK